MRYDEPAGLAPTGGDVPVAVARPADRGGGKGSMLQELLGELQSDDSLRSLASAVGASSEDISRTLSAAVPVLVGALGRNASSRDGADSLLAALDRDHDGSVLDDLAGFLGSGTGDGEDILRHVLGSRRPAVEEAVGQKSGVSAGLVGELLTLVAPLVMGWLGRQRSRGRLDAAHIGAQLEDQLAGVDSSLGGLLSILDRDGDGEVGDDIGGMLGRLLS